MGFIPAWAGKPGLRPTLANHHGFIPAWAGKPRRRPDWVALLRVHPRVGGETGRPGWMEAGISGSSPRGRGNPDAGALGQDVEGFIPAWAGKPACMSAWTLPAPVHPRVGGETASAKALVTSSKGSSPRGRGNHIMLGYGIGVVGFIPAWAGKPGESQTYRIKEGVHPRVGGETDRALAAAPFIHGSSPRGRGNRQATAGGAVDLGFIPAWAGKPPCANSTATAAKVHPRVGGETPTTASESIGTRGSSPRGRGNLWYPERRRLRTGFIPAWAGKPPASPPAKHKRRVHPRVGGETGPGMPAERPREGSSPRGRGNLRQVGSRLSPAGFIPAWAGKPPSLRRDSVQNRVHPRVGGETARFLMSTSRGRGSSPRGRGNPILKRLEQKGWGFIPAWAGKPPWQQHR